LWQEQAPLPDGLGGDALPERCDVAIVGGGYTGLGAARALAKLGIEAVVLEAEPLGHGASSRNGGKALVGLKHDASHVVKQLGATLGEALWRASLRGIDLLEEIAREERIDCDFSRCGSTYLAAKPAHFAAMQRESEWLDANFGYARVDVPPEELAAEIGTTHYFGGTVDPPSAGIHPAKWARGLAVAASGAGATLCADTEVQEISRRVTGFRVGTSRGELLAREVLLATNGYTGPLNRGVQRRVVPVGSYIIATGPLDPAHQRRISPLGRMFYDSKWFLKYFRLTPDGRMLFGGRTTISPDQDLRRSAKLLRQEMVAMFPELAAVPITNSWSGRLGVTFDGLPHIGRSDGIHYALGYGGHGVALSILLAEHVAQLIASKRESSVFLEIPHATRFFHRGDPWFRPLLGAGLRLLDRIS
jgi:glycine/D-amino acid oxidase-like deaminating enzyme